MRESRKVTGDWMTFAAVALNKCISASPDDYNYEQAARDAGLYADAMCKEIEKRERGEKAEPKQFDFQEHQPPAEQHLDTTAPDKQTSGNIRNALQDMSSKAGEPTPPAPDAHDMNRPPPAVDLNRGPNPGTAQNPGPGMQPNVQPHVENVTSPAKRR